MKLGWTVAGGVLLLAASPVGAAAPPAPDDYGTQPTFADAVRIGEEAIKGSLIDPDSARIEWPYNFIAGTLKPLLGHKNAGYYTCGFVNARNRMGGYTGRTWFLIMEKNGAVTSLAIGEPDKIDTASATCPGLVKKAYLPAAPALPLPTQMAGMTAPAAGAGPVSTPEQWQKGADDATAKGGYGFSLAPTPLGGLVVAVGKDSPAASAGLKPGEMIESLNGISIKGMAPASVFEMLGRTGPSVTLSVVGIGDVKVTKRP
jgi:hypothetical protein